MPYKNQGASKGGHIDIARNPDVNAFLAECNYLKQPSEEEAKEMAKSYLPAPISKELPRRCIAVDGSKYEAPISTQFPSTRVGYVKISMVLVDLAEYGGLRTPGSRFVDPYKVAELHNSATGTTFALPSSNIRFRGNATVQQGFRQAVFGQLSDERSAMASSGRYTMLDALYNLARLSTKPDELYAHEQDVLYVTKCPSCHEVGPWRVPRKAGMTICSRCNDTIYATDSLRLHETVTDFASNEEALTRFMNASEHLLVAAFVMMLADLDPNTLSDLAIVLDGPLALFGQPAWLSLRLTRFYFEINRTLRERGLKPFLLLGLQKEGQLMDHARSIEKYIPANSLRLIDDHYRNLNVRNCDDLPSKNFGDETYFGQDFIFKTSSNMVFAFAMPYPLPCKAGGNFKDNKAQIDRYTELTRCLNLIRYFEFDLYRSAVVPVALAHRHASISLIPGGKVLDLISRKGLAGRATT